MKETGYLYNNEAIACVAIGYFLKQHRMISMSKILFVLPFVLHEPTVKKLRNRSYKRSLEEFILKNPECFINFNARFLDFLPLAINALTILSEIGIAKIKGEKIFYNYNSLFSPDKSNEIGNRAKNILPAIDRLDELMKEQDVNSFYLKLKIEL